MAKRKELEVNLEVKFVPLEPEKEAEWRAGLLSLLELLLKPKFELEQTTTSEEKEL